MKKFRRDYWIVFRKELRELLRDRRSLFWLFAPPIILPALAICAALFIGTQAVRIAQDGVPVLIENGEAAPELVERFTNADTAYIVDPPADPSTDAFGEAAIIVSIPPDFQETITAGQTAQIKLITKDGSLITFIAQAAVRTIIEDYSRHIRDQRLDEVGLSEAWLNPIEIGEGRRTSTSSVTSTATTNEDEEEGGGLGIVATIFLPLAVTSWLLGGGMGMILDTTVGEKERQTIENLLVTPANRVSVVLGKMTVVFIFSMIVMSLWLSEGLLLNGFSSATSDLGGSNISSSDLINSVIKNSEGAIRLVAILLFMIIPFTIMLNGVVMAWCGFAANYREANLFMALVQLGLPATVLLTIFSLPSDVANAVYAIPLFGTIVGIRDLFSSTLSTSGLLINVITTSIYAILGIALAAWVFGREWSLTRGLQ